MEKQAGITLIEILIVIAIVAVLGASTTPFLSSFLIRNSHEVALSRVVGALRKAQAYSMVGKDHGVWGVCLGNQKVILYRGSCANPSYQENYSYPSSITVTGLSDVTFSFGRGEPSSTGSIVVSSSLANNSVVINQGGGISFQ